MLIHKTENRMRKQVVILVLWLICGMSVAQNETDAFRYSQYSPTGTARYSSLSGAIGAYGADFTCLSANNPAGLGLYKRSEITITLAVPYTKITSDYNGERLSERKYGFTLNNLGFVGTFSNSDNAWKKVQFATGLNNLAQYKGTSIIVGPNIGGIAGTTNFFDHVARHPGLMPGLENDAHYYNLMKDGYSNVNDYFNQMKIIETNGYLNEYIFSLGCNYDDKIFLGATIGVPFFNYTQRATYTESRNNYYDSLIIRNDFKSRGTGVNLKLGIIYQPAKFVRLGAAFHTPTFYPKVRESYEDYFEIKGVYSSRDSLCYDVIGPLYEKYGGVFDYQLFTPYHAIANLAFIFKTVGFINVDYDFTDYSMSHLSGQGFIGANKSIEEHYQGVHTIRAGGEVNISKIALRLGYSYSTNPYKNVEYIIDADGTYKKLDGTYQSFSAGIGYKSRVFFADFAYMYRYFKHRDFFYDAESIFPYSSRNVNQVFTLTFGFKFGK